MTSLPDVNVLVAILWESHIHHQSARRWFRQRTDSWATCPITQTGFVRVSSNPRVLPDAISVTEASAVLAALCEDERHEFLSDNVSFVSSDRVPHDRLIGYRQVTDAHLLAIANSHGSRVVTFDKGVEELATDPGAVQLLVP